MQTAKIYTDTNVLDAAIARFEYIFTECGTICFCTILIQSINTVLIAAFQKGLMNQKGGKGLIIGPTIPLVGKNAID